MPPIRASRSRNGSSAACMPTATACRAPTGAPSTISARSPTAIPMKCRARRRRGSSPTPSSRSATIIRPAFPIRRSLRIRCARDMLGYAATYFGDADAQYELGRLYLNDRPSDPHQAARWFQLAATKGQCRAEAALGDMLFHGQTVPRQAAGGLMWLTLSKDCAGSDEAWIKPLYDSAFQHASDDERTMALVYLEDWMKGRRD